ncbi:MAG: hypothetical protein AB1659_00915 [Thermodesulfobacteriota bacterium]
MGKNSLVKSTAKKKPAPKKKSKKTEEISIPSPAPAPPPEPPSMAELLARKFDGWQSEKRPLAKPIEKELSNGNAPPFFSGKTEEETRRLKALLLKKFDLNSPPEPSPVRVEEKKSEIETLLPEKEPDPLEKKSSDEGPVMKEKVKKPETSIPKTQIEPPTIPVKSCEPPKHSKEPYPIDRFVKYAAAGFILLLLLIVAVSSSNSNKYFVQPANGGIEIWKGIFAPLGKNCFMQLPGMNAPKSIKAEYTEEEAFTFVFQYYLQKSEALLEVQGMPDFDGIKSYLKTALDYATTESQKAVAHSRINHIDLMLLLYKADVALGKATLSGAESALKYLEQAASLDIPSHQAALVRAKTEAARKIIATEKTKETGKNPASKQ